MAFATLTQISGPPSRFQNYPIRGPIISNYAWYALPLGEEEFSELGALDLSLKKIVKQVTGAVKKVGQVAVRLVPGAVSGFLTGGPVGAVVGAAAGYESARRAGGHGLSIQGSELLKSVGMGAAAGTVTSAVSGAFSQVAPSLASKIGVASPFGTTTGVYTTGLISPVSQMAFKVGAGSVGLLKGMGTLIAGQSMMSKPGMREEQAPPVPVDYSQIVTPDYATWLQQRQGQVPPSPTTQWAVPAVASDQGASYFNPTVLPGSGASFGPPETSPMSASISGVPIKYIIIAGVGLLAILALAKQQPRYSKNPKPKRRKGGKV